MGRSAEIKTRIFNKLRSIISTSNTAGNEIIDICLKDLNHVGNLSLHPGNPVKLTVELSTEILKQFVQFVRDEDGIEIPAKGIAFSTPVSAGFKYFKLTITFNG